MTAFPWGIFTNLKRRIEKIENLAMPYSKKRLQRLGDTKIA
jgi:hypothetical protein